MGKDRYTRKTRTENDPLTGMEHYRTDIKNETTGKTGIGRSHSKQKSADRAQEDLHKKKR